MDFDWASYGLGALTMLVVIILMVGGFGFWLATRTEQEKLRHDASLGGYDEEQVPRLPIPLSAVGAGFADATAEAAPVPQLGYVDHHRTRPRRGGR